ncbi:MAG: ATP-dependent zinc metalloprotease FtsH [Desulfobacteraceae bacterium]|nr:ATP-dependent zinc metalloprotease FtsH [Desulfobacteraceae bacterium]
MNAFNKNLALWIVIVLMMIMLYNIFNTQQQSENEIGYSQFLSMVEDGRVNNVVIQGQKLTATGTDGDRFSVYAPQDNELISILRNKGVSIKAKPEQDTPWFVSVLVSWFPMILLIAVWIFFMRQMQGGGGGKAMSFGKSGARMLSEQGAKITFNDVAGVDEAKEEVVELVEFLKNPKKYTRLGGRIPKGVLMVGGPGTGKTLLARAIAGEAGVPFFSISGSDFVEMFVGVGASRVRDLFVQGKKNAPCLIFIDEIDAVGRQRGAGLGGGHDEREQTLNQLLVEMDGFESNEGVILIASTNRPDVLDPALLRPGRFDRQVVVPMPDIKGRTEIIEVHLKRTPTDSDVDPVVLAKGTPGFSGADLENMVNEAALIAAKKDKEKVNMVDFEEAKDKIFMGLERKSKVMKEEDKKVTAYHEGGHALVARFSPETDSINKITIIPRGRAAGVTWFLPEERDFMFKDQLMSELAVALGGRVSEELVFNRISTGGANDIKKATELAQKMTCSWGMSETLGPLTYGQNEEHIFLGREIAQHRDYSEATAQKIDAEVAGLVKESYNRAKQILNDNMDILNRLAERLLDKETVMGKELDDLIYEMRPGIRLPSDPSDHTEEEARDKIKENESESVQDADSQEQKESTDEAL